MVLLTPNLPCVAALHCSIDTKIYPWITNGVGIDWSDCGPIHRCGQDFAYCWDYPPLIPISESLLNMGQKFCCIFWSFQYKDLEFAPCFLQFVI